MNEIFEILTNREIALLFWGIAILALLLFRRQTRVALYQLVKQLFHPTLLILTTLLLDYILLIIDFLLRIGYWNVSLLKETVFWAFGASFILVFNAISSREFNQIKMTIKDTTRWVIILEFLVNFYTFSLVAEILLMPILFFLGILQSYAVLNTEYKKAESVFKRITSVAGIGLLSFVVYKAFVNPESFFTISTLKAFLLPVILTALFIPFIYCIAVYSQYESLFNRLDFLEQETSTRRRLKWHILKVANLNLNKLANISKGIAKLLLIDGGQSLEDIVKISKVKPQVNINH
ncbi:MAG: hypothetical protein H6569_07995 [Lewinellaceae bacterium]|nr:hypothetical protein [Lewinellaceae bacterium]